jgi:serine/threonine protein kinase
MKNYEDKIKDEEEKIVEVLDSPGDNSRITLAYQFNTLKDFLGKGGYGEVYKVQLMSNGYQEKYYAIKIFDKNILSKEPVIYQRVLNEIKIHRSLEHDNVCKYENSFEDNKNVYILMEYCQNGNLASFLKLRGILEEIEIRYYMFQILLVLRYLRKVRIIHRDLTLVNILLKNFKTVKLGDFGLAVRERDWDDKSQEVCGTPGYFTPESLNFRYSYKTDIFYFGVCIFYLLGGKLQLNSSQQSFDYFSGGGLQIPKHMKLSLEAYDILKRTITVENERLNLEQLYHHPFFKNINTLSYDKFPDYNEKDYMEKIAELTKKFNIKQMERKDKIEQLKLKISSES